jgi:chemotaxis protein MotB
MIDPHNRPLPVENTQVAKPQWLTIFNDLVTLLMVFFVLLFSLGSLDTKRFQNFQNAMQSAIGILDNGPSDFDGTPSKNRDQPHVTTGESSDTQKMQRAADGLTGLADTEGLEAEYTPKGIQLILDDRLLFALGSAELSPAGMNMLRRVGTIIKPFNRYIRIEGHTDDLPINTRQYPSNWELSTARAISVVTYFINESGFAPSHLSAAGYGSSRPRETNTSEKNRSKNRRVEIILTQPVTSTSLHVQKDHGGN